MINALRGTCVWYCLSSLLECSWVVFNTFAVMLLWTHVYYTKDPRVVKYNPGPEGYRVELGLSVWNLKKLDRTTETGSGSWPGEEHRHVLRATAASGSGSGSTESNTGSSSSSSSGMIEPAWEHLCDAVRGITSQSAKEQSFTDPICVADGDDCSCIYPPIQVLQALPADKFAAVNPAFPLCRGNNTILTEAGWLTDGQTVGIVFWVVSGCVAVMAFVSVAGAARPWDRAWGSRRAFIIGVLFFCNVGALVGAIIFTFTATHACAGTPWDSIQQGEGFWAALCGCMMGVVDLVFALIVIPPLRSSGSSRSRARSVSRGVNGINYNRSLDESCSLLSASLLGNEKIVVVQQYGGKQSQHDGGNNTQSPPHVVVAIMEEGQQHPASGSPQAGASTAATLSYGSTDSVLQAAVIEYM